MALPGGFTSPFKYQSESQAAEREKRERERRRQEQIAQAVARREDERARLQNQIQEKYIAPIQRRETERASLNQLVSKFAQDRETDRQTSIATEREKLNSLIAPRIKGLTEGLFGGDSELRSRRHEWNAAQNQAALDLNVANQGGSGFYRGNERVTRPTTPVDLSDTGQAFGSGLVPGMVQRSGIQATPEEIAWLQRHGPEVTQGLIEQGNIGPAVPLGEQGSPHDPLANRGLSGLITNLTSSGLRDSELDAVRNFNPGGIPIGEEAARLGEFFTSPLGMGATAIAPGTMAAGMPTAFGLGTAGRLAETELGIGSVETPVGNIGPRSVGEAYGFLRGPGLEEALGSRAAARAVGSEFVPGMVRTPLEMRLGQAGVALGQETGSTAARAIRQNITERPGGLMNEAGGTTFKSPKDEAFESLQRVLSKQPADWAATMELRSAEIGRRASAAQELEQRLISEGVSPMEATLRSTSELRGKMNTTAAAGFDLSPRAEAWLWDEATKNLQSLERVNLATMFSEMADDSTRVVRPFEKRLLEKAAGPDFAELMDRAARTRAEGIRAADEAKRLAGPPAPGVGGIGEIGPNVGQQGILHEVAPEIIPPPGTAAAKVTAKREPYFIDYIADSLGLLRAVMASSDLSFYRQTGKTIGRHPLISAEAGKMASKAAFSEKTAVQWMDELGSEGVKGKPGYMVRVRTDEGLREIGLGDVLKERYMAVPGTPGFATSGLLSRPEFFVSRWGARLPGVKQSGRAFAIGWNTQFQGVSRDIIKRVTKAHGGEITSKQLETALNLTERLLGRGELGNSWFGNALKALGFAPGYRISGPQAFANLLNLKDPTIMRIAADELFTWATLGGTIMTAAKFGAGASVVTALGSPHFGRIKFPGSDTYYNIWGTDQVLARTILQVIKGEKVDRYGNITPLGNQAQDPSRYTTAFVDALDNYLRSGEDPIVGLLADLRAGETYQGKGLKWDLKSLGTLVQDRMPMIAGDLWDVSQTDGPIAALLSFPGAFTGTTGISSYKPTAEEFKSIPRYNTSSPEVMQDAFGQAVPPLNLTANEERELMGFVGRDGPVQEYIRNQQGPRPEGVTTDDIIRYVGKQEGLDNRMIAGAMFISKADSHMEWWNPAHVKFGLENESSLADRFNLDTQAWKTFRQRAQEAGLLANR